MMIRWLYICAAGLSFAWPGGRAEKVLGEETADFDFDGLPGALHDFTVEVGARNEDCYYQTAKAGGHIHISFEVLRGGDMQLGLNVHDMTRRATIATAEVGMTASLRVETSSTGSYAICLDNTHSILHSKLVYMHYVTHVNEDWEKYFKEIMELSLISTNFTTSIHQVHESIVAVMMHQIHTRRNVLHDQYTTMDNSSYIQQWSILQCVVIISCSCIQVYFVRRLFRTENVTPRSHKPRA